VFPPHFLKRNGLLLRSRPPPEHHECFSLSHLLSIVVPFVLFLSNSNSLPLDLLTRSAALPVYHTNRSEQILVADFFICTFCLRAHFPSFAPQLLPFPSLSYTSFKQRTPFSHGRVNFFNSCFSLLRESHFSVTQLMKESLGSSHRVPLSSGFPMLRSLSFGAAFRYSSPPPLMITRDIPAFVTLSAAIPTRSSQIFFFHRVGRLFDSPL